MSFSDILVHLSDDPRNGARIQAAILLAQKHLCHVTGLYTAPPPTWPAISEGYIPVDMIEKLIADARSKAEKQQKMFLETCHMRQVSCEWHFLEEDPLTIVPNYGHYTDLILVGQVEEEAQMAPPSGIPGLPEELALSAGRPVLVIPYVGEFKVIGERVLIAWNGSREATRAVHDALPILRQARKVIVLSVDADGADSDSEDRRSGQDICRHLARYKIEVEAQYTVAKDTDIADVLLDASSDCSADLLVMGAYGHSRFREFILGGVTESILAQMTVPVLMAH